MISSVRSAALVALALSASPSALLAQGTQISCKQVGPENMAQWVAQTAQRKGLSMDREACTWLAENTEGNLLAAHQKTVSPPANSAPQPLRQWLPCRMQCGGQSSL